MRSSVKLGNTNPSFPISSHCVITCLLIDKLLMLGYCSGESAGADPGISERGVVHHCSNL